MKRRELARLTGYSERHISRIAREIPGVKPTSGGQCSYDEANPELKLWIAEANTKTAVKQHLKLSGAKKRKCQIPTMIQNLTAIERFVDAFKQFQETGVKVRLTRIGAEIPDGISKDHWIALGKMLKLLKDVPSGDGILLLLHFCGHHLPESLTAFSTILQLPMFEDFRKESMDLPEHLKSPTYSKKSATAHPIHKKPVRKSG